MMVAYRETESKYKGGAEERYVTYDLKQKGANGQPQVLPKVKRVYIAGEVQHWDVGNFEMRSGRTAHGVRIEYEQSRKGYTRTRAGEESHVPPGMSLFTKVVEVPDRAINVAFHSELPERYRSALQDVR
jgi:hypothetical protein